MNSKNVSSMETHNIRHLIGQGCLTNSKHSDRFPDGIYPHVVKGGRGCTLFDENEKPYIDFICGLGTNLYGYANIKIRKAIENSLAYGASHSFPTIWESKAARSVMEVVPWAEKLKFVNDGSSACTAACIMARAFQQEKYGEHRKYVCSVGYHGWHPEFTSLTPPAYGISGVHRIWEGNCIYKNDPMNIAAVIVEPVILDDGKQAIDALKNLMQYCEENGIIIIFDETITALRYPKLTVARCYNLNPDLIIFGKALGNGEKISCIAGRRDILDGDYFVSGTYHGHVPTLAAVIECIRLAKHSNDHDVEVLQNHGLRFQREFNDACKPIGIRLEGYGTRGAFIGDQRNKASLMQELAKAGFLFGPSFFLNWHLIEYLDDVISTINAIVGDIKCGKRRYHGRLPTSPFSSRARRKK